MRLLPPMAQHVFGLKQGVHALLQKCTDTLRVTGGLRRIAGCIEQHVQAVGNQVLSALNQRAGTVNLGQRITVQLLQAAVQQAVGLKQQLDFVQVQRQMVCFVFTHQMVQRCGQLSHAQHTRHVRTAFEGVHGTLQFVAGIQRQLLAGVIEKTLKCVEVALRFLTENIEQLRVETEGLLLNQQRQWMTFGQVMGLGGQCVDVIALTLTPLGKRLNQTGQHAQYIFE